MVDRFVEDDAVTADRPSRDLRSSADSVGERGVAAESSYIFEVLYKTGHLYVDELKNA